MVEIFKRPSPSDPSSAATNLSALGYFLSAFVIATAMASDYGGLTGAPMTVVWGTLLGGAANVLFLGLIWGFVGSRLFGGRISCAHAVRGVGVALLWPAAFQAPLALLFPAAVAGLEAGRPSWFLAIGAFLVLAVWAVARVAVALKRLNDFQWWRAWGAALWLPALLGLVLLRIRL